nr:conserved uncharacterized protein [uncultured bacterium]
MQWADVLQDPSLQDLPYKIELNEWGQIVMSPASNRHGRLQYRVGHLIERQLNHGAILAECSIDTDSGVKVADIVWCSDAFLQQFGDLTPFPSAPEICVEVVSPSNNDRQLQWKMALYFARGAQECWLVYETGEVRFYDTRGELTQSTLCAAIPSRLT